MDDEEYGSPDFWPCSIITKDDGNKVNSTYTVRIFQSKSHRTAPWERESEPLFLTNYPRSSIRYFVKPYRSIQHSADAFRRFIGLPKDMWPEKLLETADGGAMRCIIYDQETDKIPSTRRILSPLLRRSRRVLMTGKPPPTVTSRRY